MNQVGSMAFPWMNLAYLSASVLFIAGIRGLRHPRSAIRGNLLGAFGMALAAGATLLSDNLRYPVIVGSVALGGGVGIVAAQRVRMISMPQMVALLNGLGGAASALVASVALARGSEGTLGLSTSAVSAVIGVVTLTGSLVAFGKLQGLLKGSPSRLWTNPWLRALGAAATLAAAVWFATHSGDTMAYWTLIGAAAVLGALLVMPIGGADMPVVVSLLNAYSGVAAAGAGFALQNTALIIAGSLVGASGLVLTRIMCRAMNRSLANVLFGGVAAGAAAHADDVYEGRVRSTSADEVAMMLEDARRVIVVPGYGMAVAQAQHAVAGLGDWLANRGATVEYAIHPVAGRMPGHMNVLLAEANVPYERLRSLEDINSSFERTDVVLVVGANDVVNPDARDNSDSPIAGMPVLTVDKARSVVVIKRSLSPGFAGIPNPLFMADNTVMLFGDGAASVEEIGRALRES